MTLAPFPQYNRFAIRAALDQGGIKLRDWQRDALIRATAADCPDAALIVAIMGAGKSIVLALLACAWRGPVVVSTSSVMLVEALRPLIARLSGETVGAYYTGAKDVQRITVVCLPSLSAYAAASTQGPGLLWIADEAHKCERASVDAFLAAATPARRIGMTATPYKADGGLTLWQHELLRYGIEDAITDSALVPFRVQYATGKGYADLDELVMRWMRDTASEGPCVVSAADIADCEAFALRCCDEGLRVAPIHSRNRKTHATALADLQSGALDAVVHCHMLSEGVDMPFLRRLAIRHARGSRVEYAQEIGRVLRATAGKSYALVYDPWQVTLTHQIQSPVEVAEAIEAQPKAKPAEPPGLCIDPLTGLPIEWADLPAKEKKRIWLASDSVSYVSQCALAYRIQQLVSDTGERGLWRSEPATVAQIGTLRRLGSTVRWVQSQSYRMQGIANEDREYVQALCRAYAAITRDMSRLRRGLASDLLTCIILLLSGRPSKPYFGEPALREHYTRSGAIQALRSRGVDPAPLL